MDCSNRRQLIALLLLIICHGSSAAAQGRPTHANKPGMALFFASGPVVHQSGLSQNSGATDDANMAAFKLLVARQAKAWEQSDFSLGAADWLPAGELVSPGGRVPASQLGGAITGYTAKFTDLRVSVKNVFLTKDGSKAAIEWDWTVTRRRDGVRGTTHDAIIVELVGGKISSWREYFDFGNSVDAKP